MHPRSTLSSHALRDIPQNRDIPGFHKAMPSSVGGELHRVSSTLSARSSTSSVRSGLGADCGAMPRSLSPQSDLRRRHDPLACSEYAAAVYNNLLQREKTMPVIAGYLESQPEINEKMRTILIDWMVDVHLKFKLHAQTLFLAVDIVNRFLAVSRVTRSQLQLVGVTAVLLAAKYEEIWPPEIKDCVFISAKTYKEEEILVMERSITAALQFRLTVPNPYPFLQRALTVANADPKTRNLAMYFLEHAALHYGTVDYLPSTVANAAMYLANVVTQHPDPWDATLQHYTKVRPHDRQMLDCAAKLLSFTNTTVGSRYQAVRRKYSSVKYMEVAKIALPAELL
jgi:hypothetical protein